jgi:hypothetical protein
MSGHPSASKSVRPTVAGFTGMLKVSEAKDRTDKPDRVRAKKKREKIK